MTTRLRKHLENKIVSEAGLRCFAAGFDVDKLKEFRQA